MEFGKLILTRANEPSQEFLLNKPEVAIGRATTNDIILNETRVSRNHAHILCDADGIKLSDLNSANGVWVNGQRVAEAKLHPGDRFAIGENVLEYQAPAPDLHEEATLIDTELELERTLHEMTVPVSLNDTSRPRLVVHAPDRTWEIPLDADSLTIGRTSANGLALDYAKISRQHAVVERRGSVFVLRDLQSTNGTRIGVSESSGTF